MVPRARPPPMRRLLGPALALMAAGLGLRTTRPGPRRQRAQRGGFSCAPTIPEFWQEIAPAAACLRAAGRPVHLRERKPAKPSFPMSARPPRWTATPQRGPTGAQRRQCCDPLGESMKDPLDTEPTLASTVTPLSCGGTTWLAAFPALAPLRGCEALALELLHAVVASVDRRTCQTRNVRTARLERLPISRNTARKLLM